MEANKNKPSTGKPSPSSASTTHRPGMTLDSLNIDEIFALCNHLPASNGNASASAATTSPAATPAATITTPSSSEAAGSFSECKFEDHYAIENRISKGSFGTVFVTKHRVTKEEYAVKVIERKRLNPKETKNVLREVSILQDCRDVDHIVKLIDFYTSGKSFYVVQILANGGDVFERLANRNTYNEKDGRDLAIHLIKAIDVLHSRKIAHRDLKPENLLLQNMFDDAGILVADFGFATYVPEEGLKTRCGTPAFVAPEVLISNNRYDERVDMWSVGCLLYMLIGGYPPFQDKHHRGLFRKIRGADFVFHDVYWKTVSVSAKQLIAAMLTVEPDFRCTAKMALESHWLRIRGQTLQGNDLAASLDEIKRFHARRTLKGAMHAVMLSVQTRFRSFSKPGGLSALAAAAKEKEGGGGGSGNGEGSSGTASGPARRRQHHSAGRLGGFDEKAGEVGLTGNIATSAAAKPEPRFSDVYDKKGMIHSGNATEVFECIHRKTKEVYAVKVIDRAADAVGSAPGGKTAAETVLHELAVLKSLQHKHIAKIIDFYEDESTYHLIMERMRGGDLFDRIIQMKKYTERDARSLARVLLETVYYLHTHGVAHRDLKPQNLLLKSMDDNADIKIADFAFACRVHTPQSLTARCGTPSYVAPEVLKNVPYDQSADMWSIGVILYLLLCGYLPFADDSQSVLFQKIRTGEWRFPTTGDGGWQDVSSDAKDVISNLLVPNPLRRWTAKQCLESTWLKVNDESLGDVDLAVTRETLKKRKAKLSVVAKSVFVMTRSVRNLSANAVRNVVTQEPKRESLKHQQSIRSMPLDFAVVDTSKDDDDSDKCNEKAVGKINSTIDQPSSKEEKN